MALAPTMAQIPAPNDSQPIGGGTQTLSIDGYVNTKFAGVGADVEIMALTRGHTDSTLVYADIIKYPEIDPIELISSTRLPGSGVVIDTIVLTRVGVHEDDANTMRWGGVYTIPSNSVGGVYGARVIAEDGVLVAVDDPTQLVQVFRGEIEKVLQAMDDAWDAANPCLDIKGEFDSLESIVIGNGTWSTFVAVATEGQGLGGSEQLWDSMLDAGHNQYNMSAGANFLDALMVLLDSDDANAGLSFITGLMLYAAEFPLPRTFDDFDEVGEYFRLFDSIENFTRFEGTGDFEAAYNALLGSDEWLALREALDDLVNNTKEFEAIQTIMQNIALLAVSGHPDAIVDALEAWAEPLMEGDMGNMTPFQVFIVRWIEMGEEIDDESDILDTDGDGIPDHIIWEYEKLLETTEGQAWTANMESSTSSAYVNDAFDKFNTLPEDIIDHLLTSVQNEVWNESGVVLMDFADWAENASGIDREMWWEPGGEEEEEEETTPSEESVAFEELYDVRTTVYDGHVLDLGIELNFWGPDDDNDYPNGFPMSMTNNHGVTINAVLVQTDKDRSKYLGRLTANIIEDAVWTLSQPMENYNGDVSNIESAKLRLETLRPSMMATMAWEGFDEIFIVSALGVIVVQDETTSVNSPYTLSALSYDATGPVQGAEVDVAIIRISPQLAEGAIAQFSPDGDVEITSVLGGAGTETEFTGNYTGNDLTGDVSVTISPYSGHDDDREYPQASSLENDIEVAGSGSSWDASNHISGLSGLVDVTTSGTTVNGLEFEIMKQVPLPGTSGCTVSEGYGYGHHVDIGWRYDTFRNDEGEFDKPDLEHVVVDWGDGFTSERGDESDSQEEWWSHDYASGTSGTQEEFDITITFFDMDGNEVQHSTNFTVDKGFWHEGEDGEGWFEGNFRMGECYLRMDDSATPSPLIINGFITDGPIEVMDEQILTSDNDGEISMTATPSLPGAYISIVQTKVVRSDGETLTGVGMNIVAATEASISLGGLTEETTLAGIPVYSVQPGGSGLTPISVTPSGMDEDEFTVTLAIMPVDLSIAFPDIGEDDWGEAESHELEFQQGDTTRTQEVRIKAPLSMIAALILEEGQLFPTALHVGFILNDPESLEMTGALGPGQTTNIALDSGNESATRILALATPRNGFDPATLDFSAFTELGYVQAREALGGWIPVEKDLVSVCEIMDAWHEERWDDGQHSNVRIELRQKANNKYASSGLLTYDPSNAVLTDSDGNTLTPVSDWNMEEWEDGYYANFILDEDDEGTYTLTSNTGYGEGYEFLYYPDEYRTENGEQEFCTGDEDMTDDEIFDMVDDLFSTLDSVAWGIGSSADLRLPILSSPNDDYTVIAVAQKGSGDNATMVAAFGSEISVPNPEPPQQENLTLSFSPPDPRPGDIVQISVMDEANQPVSGLSVLLVKDNMTLVASISNDDGLTSFVLPAGTLHIWVSGGNYYPAHLTIIVTDDGVLTDDGEELPADSDGDGVLDADDEFPDDADESADADGDGVGDNADAFPNDPDETTDSDGDGVGDNTQQESSTSSSPNLMLIGGAVAAVLVLLATLVMVAMWRRNRDDEGEWATDELEPKDSADSDQMDADQMFSTPGWPSPSVQGQMQDGYEVIEHPEGSGAWYYREQSTGQWMEWG